MAIYKAIIDFVDLKDGNRLYHAGDVYPRDGLTVTDERYAELSGSDNRARRPLIVAEPDAEPPADKPAKRRVKKDA